MTLRLAVLGDSIAAGMGADRSADTLAPLLAAHASRDGRIVEARVFAVNGARSADLGAQVARLSSWHPDTALIIIGANDLINSVPAEHAGDHLGRAVRALVGLGAQVVVVPAPDLSFMPQVPPELRGLVRAQGAALRAAQVRAAVGAGASVADVGPQTAAAFATDATLFCGDRFHPSSKGYALIADSLAPAVRAGSSARDVGARAGGACG